MADLVAAQPPSMPSMVDNARPCREFQYAVKVVSGIPNANVDRDIVAPGRYYTAINIHNPSTCKTVTFRWKVTVATPAGTPPGRITRFQKLTLRPDESVEIDTPNIVRILGQIPTKFVKGFVVVESPCELDIVAVYSAGPPATPAQPGNVVAFHTERVPARVIDACHENLDVNISTGVVDWMLTSAVKPDGTPLPGVVVPRPANVIENADIHPSWGTQPCASWIGVRGVAHDLKPPIAPGVYTFQYCFSLCSGFEDASINLSIFVDDSAVIWLNDHQVAPPPPIVGLNGAPKIVTITNQDYFLPGLNCLTFVVTNAAGPAPSGNPVGINVCGRILAARGACSGCGCSSDCGCGGAHDQSAASAQG